MAFTNVWDNTQPPDTQLASQLGADLRSLRLDVQQRMAAISGLDAAKAGFNFEAGFAGVLFFATDTKIVYQWSGAAWVPITLGGGGTVTVYPSNVETDVNNPANNQSCLEIDIPANTLAIGNHIRFLAFGQAGNSGGADGAFGLQVGGSGVTESSHTIAAGSTVFYEIRTEGFIAAGPQYNHFTKQIQSTGLGIVQYDTSSDNTGWAGGLGAALKFQIVSSIGWTGILKIFFAYIEVF